MTLLRISRLTDSAVLYVYSIRDAIQVDPPYQRLGDVWPLDKRKLLIDSIINGYDIPKLYFHEFLPSQAGPGARYQYAIIDGRQRLQSIFEFIDGRFPLSDDIKYIADAKVDIRGLTYSELANRYPLIKTRFDAKTLPIMTIQTEDLELIEDMFSRLNEAVPLNAAEKRNAFGGPVPPVIRNLVRAPLFKRNLPFGNNRYRHHDLAAKFLLIAKASYLVDTKKAYVDSFVRSTIDEGDAKRLEKQAKSVLAAMAKRFVSKDDLLRSVGMVVLYYYLFYDAINHGWSGQIERKALWDFEELRKSNRKDAEEDITKADYNLLEFDRYVQSPNDGVALRFRYAVLRQYIGPEEGRPELPRNS